MNKTIVGEITDVIKDAGGEIEEGPHRLPDNSGFMIASFPLPKNHWIYQLNKEGFTLPPPMPFRLGTNDPRYHELVEKVLEAGKYAIRASTMNGEENDFDPDAMIRNFTNGLFGYHTADGLSRDNGDNPTTIPPLFFEAEREKYAIMAETILDDPFFHFLDEEATHRAAQAIAAKIRCGK